MSSLPSPSAPDDSSNAVDDGNEANSQLLELQDAFVQALSATGALGKIRAQLRAVAVGLLRADPDMQSAAVGRTHSWTGASRAVQVTALLVEDYLTKRQFQQTAGVFLAEAGTTSLPHEAREAAQGLACCTNASEGHSALELLVESALSGGLATEASAKTPRRAAAATTTPPIAPEVDDDARGTFSASATEESVSAAMDDIMADSSVQKFLEHYEDSLPYGDEEGAMCDVDDFDEIEVV